MGEQLFFLVENFINLQAFDAMQPRHNIVGVRRQLNAAHHRLDTKERLLIAVDAAARRHDNVVRVQHCGVRAKQAVVASGGLAARYDRVVDDVADQLVVLAAHRWRQIGQRRLLAVGLRRLLGVLLMLFGGNQTRIKLFLFLMLNKKKTRDNQSSLKKHRHRTTTTPTHLDQQATLFDLVPNHQERVERVLFTLQIARSGGVRDVERRQSYEARRRIDQPVVGEIARQA
jgi:hypothetical protein